MKEKKDLTRTLNDETGLKDSHLSHMRAIGERSYTLKKSITDDNEKVEIIETNMNNDELEKFKNKWEEKWTPLIRENESGILSQHSCQIFEDVSKKELKKKSTTRFEEDGTINEVNYTVAGLYCGCGHPR